MSVLLFALERKIVQSHKIRHERGFRYIIWDLQCKAYATQELELIIVVHCKQSDTWFINLWLVATMTMSSERGSFLVVAPQPYIRSSSSSRWFTIYKNECRSLLCVIKCTLLSYRIPSLKTIETSSSVRLKGVGLRKNQKQS